MIRKFSSYGPVDINQHYYAPREELIERGCQLLVGENPDQGGHYITVWAPRQRGKTWVMQQVLYRLNHDLAYAQVDAIKINLEHLKLVEDIVNLISKAKQEPYQTLVLELFQTDAKQPFHYDDNRINFLYMHGVIDVEVLNEVEYYARFACPFVQKRLFNYFAYEFFRDVGKTHTPFENLDDTVTESTLSVYHLLRRYESYLRDNRAWLFQAIPRRSDLRPYEALYHFNLSRFLTNFLDSFGVQLIPEFPTGNGKIDLLFRHANQRYGLELKTYSTRPAYRRALQQAALYGQQIQLAEIWVAFFVEEIDDNNRQTYETLYLDPATGVNVRPVFVATGS